MKKIMEFGGQNKLKLLKIPKKLPRVALMGRNRRDERMQKEEEEERPEREIHE